MKKSSPLPILVAEDLSARAPAELRRAAAVRDHARALARRLGAPIELVHVEGVAIHPTALEFADPFVRTILRDDERRLGRLAKALGPGTRTRVLEGFAAPTLIRLAARPRDFQLLAQGTHGRRGLGRMLLGSVAEEVIRNSSIPVLTVGPQAVGARPSARKPTLVVATDLGEGSRRAEALAQRLALALGGTLVLTHSLRDSLHPILQTASVAPAAAGEIQRWIEDVRRSARQRLERKRLALERAGVECRIRIDERLAEAHEAVLLAVRQEEADYVVAGTHGRNLLAGAFFGTTARRLIQAAPVPVITVRSR